MMGVNPLELIQGTGNSITHQSSRSAQSRKVWYKLAVSGAELAGSGDGAEEELAGSRAFIMGKLLLLDLSSWAKCARDKTGRQTDRLGIFFVLFFTLGL